MYTLTYTPRKFTVKSAMTYKLRIYFSPLAFSHCFYATQYFNRWLVLIKTTRWQSVSFCHWFHIDVIIYKYHKNCKIITNVMHLILHVFDVVIPHTFFLIYNSWLSFWLAPAAPSRHLISLFSCLLYSSLHCSHCFLLPVARVSCHSLLVSSRPTFRPWKPRRRDSQTVQTDRGYRAV